MLGRPINVVKAPTLTTSPPMIRMVPVTTLLPNRFIVTQVWQMVVLV